MNAYVALTKPRIIELLLVTTVPAMVLAARGIPPLDLVFWTLVGGTMAAGAANAINCYIDRDIDLLMTRTRRRPLPAHEVNPEDALVFGLVLGVLALRRDGVLRQPRRRVPDAARDGFLRRHLHDDPEALDAPEHRARRSGRGIAAGHRLGRGDGRHRVAGALPVRDRLLLDATAFLGTVDEAAA